jgi:hypothetical protein
MTRDEYVDALKDTYIKAVDARKGHEDFANKLRETGKQKTLLKQTEREIRQYDKFIRTLSKNLIVVGIDPAMLTETIDNIPKDDN